ncbi:MAG: PAS domain S-box protein [Thiobacillus sp.]
MLRDRFRAWFFGSLRRQMVVSVVLVQCVFIGIVLWDSSVKQRNWLLQLRQDQGVREAAGLASLGAGGLAGRDFSALQTIIQVQREVPWIEEAMFLNNQGRVLAHTDPGQRGLFVTPLPTEPALRIVREADEVVVTAPVWNAKQQVGWVQICLIESDVHAMLAQQQRQWLMIGLVATLVGIVLMMILSGRATRRLARIRQVADAVERGELDQRVQMVGNDEAASLSDTMNAMLDSLAHSREQLTRSEQRLSRAMDNIGEGVWEWNIATSEVTHNLQWCHLLGLPESYQKHPVEAFAALLHPDDQDMVMSRLQRALRDNTTYRSEHRMVRADGSVLWALDRGSVVEVNVQGHPLRMVGSLLDISEQRLAEQALQQSESSLRALFEAQPEGVMILDREKRVVMMNQAGLSIFGADQLDTLKQSAISNWVAADSVRTFHTCCEKISHGESSHTFEFEIITLKGTHRWLEAHGVPIRDTESGEMRILAITRDISARRDMERELLHHRNHLEEMVIERTYALDAARNEAERLSRIKSQFLANMSHEIRTPLHGVLGMAQIGFRDADDKAKDTFGHILDSGKHLLSVIDDILDFSRIEADQIRMEQRPFDLKAAIDDAWRNVLPRAEAKGLAVVNDQAADLPPWVEGDALRLNQILVNLLSNAIKFTEQGEVRLRVGRDGERLYFRVIDTGIGMDAEQASRVFSAFEQADASTTRQYGGSGLGLAISLKYAQLMGGTLEVDTAVGCGSSFTLSIPLKLGVPTEIKEDVEFSEPTQARLAGLRILAAEDVEVNCLILEDLLVQEGAEVAFAQNGQQAVNMIESAGEGSYDLVLMDIQMPVMDGYEATRRIHMLQPDLPIIGLTAHAMSDSRDACLAAGMLAHVSKPIRTHVLIETIRACLTESASEMPSRAPELLAAMPPSKGEVDWHALRQHCKGRQAFMVRIVDVAHSSERDSLLRLNAAIAQQDYEGIAFIAHGLKSLGANLQAARLFEAAKACEIAARQQRGDTLPQATHLAVLLAAVLAELARFLESEAVM